MAQNNVDKRRADALADVFRVVGKAQFCRALVAFVKELTEFDNLIIIAYHGELSPVVLYREFVDPVVYSQMDSDYINAAFILDPFYHAHLNGSAKGVQRLLDIAPDHFKRTSYYNVYYQSTTLLDEVAAFATIDSGITITACFGKDRTSGETFSRRELRVLRDYEAVVCVLLELHWQAYKPDNAPIPERPPLTERLRSALDKELAISLTPRQSEVAMYILQGHSSLSIGLNLNISIETVKVFRKQLYARCGISSQGELFAIMMPLFSRLSEQV